MSPRRPRWVGPGLALLPLVACKASPECADGASSPAGASTLRLDTRDEVCLVGDHYAGGTNAPGLVLLHMIPPDNDRSTWPASFISRFTERDWHVIALDRRGAGDSGGEPEQAYEGDGGRFDVEAAALYLVEIGVERIGLVGASNGTTSVVDYTTWAPGAARPEVAVAGLLSGGSYTENQTSMEAFAATGVPTAFAYPAAEASWNEAQQPLDPGGWAFQEYAGSAHGTDLLSAEPEVGAALESFIVDAMPAEGAQGGDDTGS